MLIGVAGPLLWAARPHRFRHSGWIAALVPALVTAWLLTQIPGVVAGNFRAESYAWVPELSLALSFRLDGLTLFFGLIVTGIGTAIALYTGYYFEDDERQGYFYALLFLFMASMLGLVWSDNLLGLFVFWEGTSITSYLLIAFKSDSREAKEGGRRAFVVTALGGLAMLGGLVLLGQMAGTYSISEIVEFGRDGALVDGPLFVPALILLLLGAFTKSAQWPFHFWLPGAMAAPTPASAYLHSATMVKAGVFLLARLHPALSHSPLWEWSLVIVGGVTMLLGSVSALRNTDLKAILAYATVSQLGVLTMLLGFPVEGAPIAMVVGTLAHSLYKAPLFLAAGIVDHATGTRDIRKLAGLARAMPWLAATVVLAGLSMAGVPPLLGFVAKESLLESAEGLPTAALAWSALAVVILSAAFTAAAAFMFAWDLFFRRRAEKGSEAHHVHHAPSFLFVLPALLLAALGAILPFALGPLSRDLVEPAVVAIAGESAKGVRLALWHGFTLMLASSLAALTLGVLIFAARGWVRRALQSIPERLSGLAGFNTLNNGLYSFARTLTRAVQGGSMSSQVSVTLLAAAAFAAAALWPMQWVSGVRFEGSLIPPVQEIVVALLAIVAAVATVRARTRLGAIISLGVVGVVVMLYFVFFSAPDLALTQLLIDVLTVVLMVLVFFRVGPDRLPKMRPGARFLRIFVALAMGFFGFALVLVNSSVQVASPIYPYFERFSVPVGQGANIVNVILVDFRGYDTLGEITVLGIAALGGFALLRAPRMTALRARLLKRLQTARDPAAAQEPPATQGQVGD